MVSFCKTKKCWLVFCAMAAVAMFSQAKAAYQDVVLFDNPDYYWTFDDGSASALNHGSGTGGTLGAAEAAARGASTSNDGGLSLGQAASFSGVANQAWVADDDHGVKLDVASANMWTSFAFEFWVQIDPAIAQQYIINPTGYGYYNYDCPSILYGWSGKGLEMYANWNARTGAAFGTLEENTWYHMVIASWDNGDNTSVQTCIINGDVDNAIIADLGIDTTTYHCFNAERSFTVGSHANLDVNMMTGMVDELAVYDLSNLTANEYSAKLGNIAWHYSLQTPASSLLPGDANGDGTVDGADAAVLSENWLGSGKSWRQGDFNFDGVVDDIDATMMATNWLKAPSATSAVPEPKIALFVLTGFICSLMLYHRRKISQDNRCY